MIVPGPIVGKAVGRAALLAAPVYLDVGGFRAGADTVTRHRDVSPWRAIYERVQAPPAAPRPRTAQPGSSGAAGFGAEQAGARAIFVAVAHAGSAADLVAGQQRPRVRSCVAGGIDLGDVIPFVGTSIRNACSNWLANVVGLLRLFSATTSGPLFSETPSAR